MLQVYSSDGMGAPLRLDLCGKCFSEAIDGGGLALAVKKVETAGGGSDFDAGGIIGGPIGRPHTHPGGPHIHHRPRPWPPR